MCGLLEAFAVCRVRTELYPAQATAAAASIALGLRF